MVAAAHQRHAEDVEQLGAMVAAFASQPSTAATSVRVEVRPVISSTEG